MMTGKLAAGSSFPAITVARLAGGEVVAAAGTGWRLLVV